MKQALNQRLSAERISTAVSRPNMRWKVLFIITKATSGGAQKYVFDLATSLPKSDFEPLVAYGTSGKLTSDLQNAGIKTRQLKSLARDIAFVADVSSFFAIRKLLREYRPDVVHLNSSKAAAIGALAARFSGIPSVFTVHGWPFKEDRSAPWRAFVFLASWITALLSKHIVVVSKHDEVIAKRMGFGKKVSHIPLGMKPLATFAPDAAFLRACADFGAPDIRSDTVRLVSIGELTRNKGFAYSIKALAELKRRNIDFQYVLFGEGEERQTLEALAQTCGVADRVHFGGFVPEAARFLSGFDVLLLPSLKEGTPYVLLEAAATGIPIVATSVVDARWKDVIPRLQLIPPQDEYILADAIQAIANQPRSTNPPSFPLQDMVQATSVLYLR